MLILCTHITAPAWDFLEKYNIKYLMLARILKNANMGKNLQKIVTTKCHNFALHRADDLSISKGFANPAAVNPWSCFFQFTGLVVGYGGNEVPVHGIPVGGVCVVDELWVCWKSMNPESAMSVEYVPEMLGRYWNRYKLSSCFWYRLPVWPWKSHIISLIIFFSEELKLFQTSEDTLWGFNSPRLLRYSDAIVMSTTEKPGTKQPPYFMQDLDATQ